MAGNPARAGLSVPAPQASATPLLAVGADSRSAVCMHLGRDLVLGEALGDLANADCYRHFLHEIERLSHSLGFSPRAVAHDVNPQLRSTRYALGLGLPAVAVQHHHAHAAAVMGEWGVTHAVVALCCDGAGYGTDGAAWGCEVLRCELPGFERVGHLEYAHLPADAAEPADTWPAAAGLLHQAFGGDWRQHCPAAFERLTPAQCERLAAALCDVRRLARFSSLGRVFDGVSFLLGLCGRNRYQAEAALALEAAAGESAADPYPYETLLSGRTVRMSVAPMTAALVRDLQSGLDVSLIAARFHETVVRMLSTAAVLACELTHLDTVALAGGCFANGRLMARLIERLEHRHLRVLCPFRVSCGNAGLALGQAVVAAAILRLGAPANASRPRSATAAAPPPLDPPPGT